MNETTKNDAAAIAGSNMLATRYFFVCTAGKESNGSLSLNNFDVKTTVIFGIMMFNFYMLLNEYRNIN